MQTSNTVFLLATSAVFFFLFNSGAAFAETITVQVLPGSSVPGCEETNSCYAPYQFLIQPGDTVTWYNADSAAHTVTSYDGGERTPNGIFDSSLFQPGESFSHTFDSSGNFPFFCMVHPWMIGEVVVEGEPAPSPTSETDNPLDVPQWVITNAHRYSKGEIDDKEFLQTAEFLIDNNFVPDAKNISLDMSLEIPDWIKVNAGWWAEGNLSYDDFIQGIQYLIKSSTETSDNTSPLNAPPSGTNITIPQGTSVPGCEETSSCYTPNQFLIQQGDTVTWYNADSAAHTVTSGTPDDGPDGIFDSSLFQPGESFSHTFDSSGNFPYFCAVHPWMVGQVSVEREPPPPPPSGTDITIPQGTSAPGCEETSSCYTPNQFLIQQGDTVTWYNADSAAHTVTSGTPDDGPDGLFDSGLFMGGRTFSHTFDSPGTFPYFCMVHPWMIGQIEVEGKTVPNVSVVTTVNPKEVGLNHIVAKFYQEGTNQIQNQIDYRLNISLNGQTLLDPLTHHASSGEFDMPLTIDNSGTLKVDITVVGVSFEPVSPKTYSSSFTIEEKSPTISDKDSDGIADAQDNCPSSYNPSQRDSDRDGIGDVCDSTAPEPQIQDRDSDGVSDAQDNCPSAYNPDQRDSDRDGIGDVCDSSAPAQDDSIIRGPVSNTGHFIDITSNKKSYNSGDTVIVTPSIHPATDANVAITVQDPNGSIILTRSVSLDSGSSSINFNAPSVPGKYIVSASAQVDGQKLSDHSTFAVSAPVKVSIDSVIPADQQGNSVSTFAKERLAFAKVNLSGQTSDSALITVNIFDSSGTTLGIGSLKGTIQGQNEIVISFFIPSDASSGQATIFANVFTDWPSNGGVPLTDEASARIGIQ